MAGLPPKILLVDDRPANLLALEAVLEGLGCELVKATSGEEALKELLKHDFALVLLDVHMPGMDGYTTAAQILARPKTRNLPIVFVTAVYKDDDSVQKGYALGAADYVLKPFVPEIFRAKVQYLISSGGGYQHMDRGA